MRRMKVGESDWHIFNRGSRRMALFHDEADARVFLSRLRKAAKLAECVVWAYTLMTNHFHLVIRATSAQLRRFTHHLQRLFSVYHNKRWSLTGHAFAGPYGAVRQAGPAMLLRTLAYVFMNPVAARQTDRPEDWPWTSCRSLLGTGSSWLSLNPIPLLAEIDAEIVQARDRLRVVMQEARDRLSERKPSGEPTTTEIHAEQFEWLIERAHRLAGQLENWDPILLAVTWARQIGIFRSAIVRVLGGPLPAGRRMELTRFRRWLESDPERQARLGTP